MDEQVAVVTGADGGIGAATARRLGEAGATVVLGGRDADVLEAVAADVAEAGGSATPVRTDVRDEFDVERLIESAARAGDGIDAVVAAASVRHGDPGESPLAGASYAAFDDTLRTNARGVFATFREAVPHLTPDARLLLPVDRGARRSQAGRGVYPISVAAALAVVRGFAADLEAVVGAVDVGDTASDRASSLDQDAVADDLLWAVREAPGERVDGTVLDPADHRERPG